MAATRQKLSSFWSRMQRQWAPTASVSVNSPPMVPEGSDPSLFGIEDLDRAAAILKKFDVAPGPWDEFRGRYLGLPDWFNGALDPYSSAYADQQLRLWEWMAGREGYRAVEQEQTPEIGQREHIYRPAYYFPREPGAIDVAGKHIISTGHFLRRSGVEAGDRVLEYGAGYGQTALAFARMGALVDTVDINPHFCQAVQAQGEFFKVSLNAFSGEFGDNPRPGEKYKLIFFYESFHHCRDFIRVIGQLREHLRDDGRVLLGGEPVTPDPNSAAIPFPWGLRMDAESAGVVRWRGWCELGFQEDFLVRCFIRQGFSWRMYPCDVSEFANLHEFRPRAEAIELSTLQLAPSDAAGWHGPEPEGRWTSGRATLSLDCRQPWELTVRAANYHHQPMTVQFVLDQHIETRTFQPGETMDVVLDSRSADRLEICCEPISPTQYGVPDQRQLGVFVQRLVYSRAGSEPGPSQA